jgi:hypothetical protein
VGDHAGRCRLRRSDHTSFIATWCNNRGGKRLGSIATVKMHNKMILHVILFLVQRVLCEWDIATVSKMGPTIVVGLPKLKV